MNMAETLKTILARAQQGGWAVGHFNISNYEFLKGIAQAAGRLHAPVMIGVSEGERDFLGVAALPKLIAAYAEAYGATLFLNADHTKTVARATEAIDAGFPSVHFDGSECSLEENIEQTREVVRYARSKNPDISIEGEVGYLRGASARTQEKITLSPEDYTQPEEAVQFVEATGVDRLAIAVGNVHGINLAESQIDFERVANVRAAISERAVLVLHAGSGIAASDIRRAIKSGIANIHISTELREAWRTILTHTLQDPKQAKNAPYHLMHAVVEEIERIVAEKIQLFGSEEKA